MATSGLVWDGRRLDQAVSDRPTNIDDSPIYRFIRAIFEGVALLVIMIGIEILFFGRGTYATLDVHPFWIAVLLVTVQHGLYGGVVTAVLAAMMLDWPARPPGLDIASYYLELARLPVQWIAVALLLGVYRQSQLRLDAERVREIAHLKAVNDCIAAEVARLDEELWQFEVAAAISPSAEAEALKAGRADSVAADALALLAALRTARSSEIGQRFAAAATAFFEDTRIQLFRCDRNGAFIRVFAGSSLAGFGDEIQPSHPVLRSALTVEELYPQAMEKGRMVVIALRSSPSTRSHGLIVAECEGKRENAAAQAEGLRLLAEAATVALRVADTPRASAELARTGQIDE